MTDFSGAAVHGEAVFQQFQGESMNNQNWQLKEGDPFAPAAPDTLEHLPSHHCAKPVIDVDLSDGEIYELISKLHPMKCDKCADLERQLTEARKDAERLDYLIAQAATNEACIVETGTCGYWLRWPLRCHNEYQEGEYPTARAAIDAAMKEQA